MAPGDARHIAGLLRMASWPKGVAVTAKVDRSGLYVLLTMHADGMPPLTIQVFDRLTKQTMCRYRTDAEYLAAESRSIHGGGPGTPKAIATDDDRPEPDPAWLRVTLARIDACTSAHPFTRGLARQVMRCLEFEDIPAPEVIDYQGISVVMRWRHRNYVLEMAATFTGYLTISVSEAGHITFIASENCQGVGFRDRGRVWALARSAVQQTLGLRAPSRADLEAELA